MNNHEKYMRMALDLAKKAEGLTSPNPAVGAIIVKGSNIAGRGYHRRWGLPHAEVEAIKSSRLSLKGSTLYVTLEPCDHFGLTPPCTEAIIKNGIKKVFIAMKDPNPINNGRGIRKLNRYGIETRTGILESEARSLNEPYIKFVTKRLPYVTVKVGQSLDGKIATRTGNSRWITEPDSRLYVHKLRSKVDAVMVGANTARRDDPSLISRAGSVHQPVRVILDSRLTTPLNAKILSDLDISPVIIVTAKRYPKCAKHEKKGAQVLTVKSRKGRIDLRDLLRKLAERGISHLLVEGGGELISSLLKEKLVDRFLFFIAPLIIGGRNAITSVEGEGVDSLSDANVLKDIKVSRFSKDILIEGKAG